jgi:hypothetical protein
VESVAENAVSEHLPVLSKETLPPEWQGEHPVLCVAGRSLIDEAAAIMLAQLSTAHGLPARVEAAEALSTTNVFRLDTSGVAIVCLVYLDASGPAHMRYAVRRLRRKLPSATIILGCWLKEADPAALELLREGAKADLVASSLGDALKLCIEAAGVKDRSRKVKRTGKDPSQMVCVKYHLQCANSGPHRQEPNMCFRLKPIAAVGGKRTNKGRIFSQPPKRYCAARSLASGLHSTCR